mgnify:CR=1 FL=1
MTLKSIWGDLSLEKVHVVYTVVVLSYTWFSQVYHVLYGYCRNVQLFLPVKVMIYILFIAFLHSDFTSDLKILDNLFGFLN